MRRNLGLIMALVVVFFAIIVTVHLSQEDEAQAINVFAKTSESGSGLSGFDKIWIFNQAEADKWTRKADMPTERASFSTSVVNGKIYAIGGAIWPNMFSTVEEYDPTRDTWRKKAKMPTERGWLSTGAVNGKIYAIGGNHAGQTSMVEEYDPKTDTWRKKADMPTARSALSTSVVNGKIYAIGGLIGDNVVLSTVEADMPTARFPLEDGVQVGISRQWKNMTSGCLKGLKPKGSSQHLGVKLKLSIKPILPVLSYTPIFRTSFLLFRVFLRSCESVWILDPSSWGCSQYIADFIEFRFEALFLGKKRMF